MKKLIINDLDKALEYIEKAKNLLDKKNTLDNKDRYIQILDSCIQGLNIVTYAIQIEEKVENEPELSEKVLFT